MFIYRVEGMVVDGFEKKNIKNKKRARLSNNKRSRERLQGIVSTKAN